MMLGAKRGAGCRRLPALLIAALMAFSAALPAVAGTYNGVSMNGLYLNGMPINGTLNGVPTNGTATTGLNFMSLTVQAVHK